MRAGFMDRRIKISAPSTITDDLGQPSGEPVLVAEVWARYRPMRGSRQTGGGKEFTEAVDMFEIRWRPDIGENMTVTHGGVDYEIDRIAEIGRREGLELTCRRVS